jgi:hypothetical protein
MLSSPQSPVEFTLSKHLYRQMGDAIRAEHGKSFEDFANERPTEAYRFLTQAFVVVSDNAYDVTIDDDITLSSDLDGQEAVTGAIRQAAERTHIDTDISAFDVLVSVFEKPTILERIRAKEPKTTEVLSFRVEPPNLAF